MKYRPLFDEPCACHEDAESAVWSQACSQPRSTFVGMDEAGYGPNLGPLVIAATKWDLPEPAASFDFYQVLAEICDSASDCSGSRLHIADSKQVHQGTHGFKRLETSALSILRAANVPSATLEELWQSLTGEEFTDRPVWFQSLDLRLPLLVEAHVIDEWSSKWNLSLTQNGINLKGIKAKILTANTFNGLIDRVQSKGIVLSTTAFQLIRQLWSPAETQPALVVGDKHGGRNRYDDLLDVILDGQFIIRMEEGRELSRYRVGNTEFRFQTKGESHLPVAVASLVAKYVRELAMEVFNSFWKSHSPDLKPTKGYPQDAKRFRAEIADLQTELGISDQVLWRKK